MKVLLAAAWADSRLTHTELNYLKVLGRRFDLRDSDWHELEPLMEEPPTEGEIEVMFRDLLNRIGTASARSEVVHHLEEMMRADARISAEEHDFLDQYTTILKEASTVELLVRRMRGLFKRKPAEQVVDPDEFMRNKILYKLRRRLGDDAVTPQMRRLCLLGGLLGIVAHADGDIEERELEEIRRHIQSRGHFEQEALDVLTSIIAEESVRGLDRSRLISEYTQNADLDERVELLDLVFAVAGANSALTHAELEELRGISKALGLTHRQYIDAKLRSKSS